MTESFNLIKLKNNAILISIYMDYEVITIFNG